MSPESRLQSTLPRLLGEPVFVLAESVSAVGGAPKATRLLVELLAQHFSKVSLFVSSRPNVDTVRRIEARGIQVIAPLLGRGSRWQLQQRSLALQLLFRAQKEHPVLIHSVGLTAGARHLLTLPRLAPVLLWETTEALPHNKFVDQHILQVSNRAAAILAPSETIACNVRQTYGYQGDIRIFPFWVEPPPANSRSYPHCRTRSFMFVGRLDMDKGFEFLFEAFRQLLVSDPQAKLIVCGPGPTAPVHELAGATAEIQVRGYVEPLEYERLMAHCDALVLPSLHEGYPLSLLEACGRGKPVIATRVGSIPEVFEGRPCALLVKPRDVAALHDALRQISTETDSDYVHRQASALSLFESLNAETVIRDHLRRAYAPELSKRASGKRSGVSS